MNKRTWDTYLYGKKECSCGRHHDCTIEKILIEEGIFSKLPALLKEYDYRNICIISDKNTDKIAGGQICTDLVKAGFSCQKIVFRDEELIPDERTIGTLLIEIDPRCQLILAVGSGTINDLCKFVSFKMRLDFWVIATSPSMDGYASNVAPLIVNHAKSTYEACLPKVILGDLDILCQAPLEMIAAGVGDILGKYVCLTDWKMAHRITGEYYCGEVASLVRTSIQKVTANVDKVVSREKEAISAIMEGLILSGIAMSYVGNSRPASGSEHHLAHYWEMVSLLQGNHGALHGTKVGIAAVLTLRMYKKLREIKPDFTAGEQRHFDLETWKGDIRKAYGPAADGVIVLEEEAGKNQDSNVRECQERLEQYQEELWGLIDDLPEAEMIEQILISMNAPYHPSQIGVDKETLRNSILYAKDLRNRFGLLQILFDVGLLEQMADEMIGE